MPNIKSAKKRVLVNEKKNEENKAIKSRIATFSKKVNEAVCAGKMEEATNLFNETVSLIDKAACENIIHKNCANRKKAQLALILKK